MLATMRSIPDARVPPERRGRRMASSSPARIAVSVLMDVMVVIAVVLGASHVTAFFGAFAQTTVGAGVIRLGAFVTLPLGLPDIETPYGGTFMTDAAITMVLLLMGESLLAAARRRM